MFVDTVDSPCAYHNKQPDNHKTENQTTTNTQLAQQEQQQHTKTRANAKTN